MKKRILIALLLLALRTAAASADCLDDAAVYHHVSPALAHAMAMQESSMNPAAVNTNADGTRDIGLLGINTTHLPELVKYGITERSLFDRCVNAYVGMWIAEQNFARHGYTINGLGAYNAASPAKRIAYARRVLSRLR
jgi:soluble lytic murein transglycosylase-like protein